jgi:hypothetical protein
MYNRIDIQVNILHRMVQICTKKIIPISPSITGNVTSGFVSEFRNYSTFLSHGCNGSVDMPRKYVLMHPLLDTAENNIGPVLVRMIRIKYLLEYNTFRCDDRHNGKIWCSVAAQKITIVLYPELLAPQHIGPRQLFYQYLKTYTVGRTPYTGDQPVARPLPTHRINADSHTSSGIQTHNPRVRECEDVPCLSPAPTVMGACKPTVMGACNFMRW